MRRCPPTPFVYSLLSLAGMTTFVTLAAGWDAPGHRAVTVVAVDRLSERVASTFLGEHSVRAQAAFQSNEPDRYRGTRSAVLNHENGPDHYIDLELLPKHDLTLRGLPPLRYEFVAQLARTSTVPTPVPGPPGAPPRRGVDTRTFTDEVGFVPYAIVEHYAKLTSSFTTLRILEGLNDPQRAEQLVAAKANVIHEMGQLSHFVADAAQPLHTTIHHHGWIGENPDDFTTDRGFHAYIDGEIVAFHSIGAQAISEAVPAPRSIKREDVWAEVIALIERSHEQVRPLYTMHKDGSLRESAGRAFILARLADGASTLAGLYESAWNESTPTEQQVKDFLKYDGAVEMEAAGAAAPITPTAAPKPTSATTPAQGG